MIAEKWEQIKDLFHEALELSAEQRQSFLTALGQEDPAIAEEVARLLRAHEEADDFLVEPCSLASDLLEHLEVEEHRFSSGEVLCGRFRIVHLIGQGGMGEVYKAWDEELEDYVALKTLRLEISRHELFTSRFRREIQLARKVTHPNVCRIFDSFKHPVGDGTYISFLSMELLQGQTLAEYLKNKERLSIAEAMPIARQIIAGLSAIHAAGIVHRDLKPSNLVLVPATATERKRNSANSAETAREAAGRADAANNSIEQSFVLKITDFGIAGRLPDGPSTGHTEVSKLLGTPDYMAPELLENARASIQSDIYSLGLILYEMLTGAKWKRLYSRTPTPEKKALKVDNQWKHATLCCLEKAPAKRPRSVGAVSILLNTPPPRKWPVYGGAAIILFLLTLLAVWKLRPHHINPDAQLAVDLARRAIENPSQDGFNTAIADYKRALALDPKWAQPWAELAYAYAAASNARYIDGSTASVEARKAALRAIEIDPHLGKAVAALAWTDSLDFDEWPKAEERFRTALRLNPDDGAIHYWFGVHLRKKGRYKEAESHDQLALRLTHGNDPYVWYELSFLYWTSGQILKFHDHMQEELKAFPNSPWTRFLNARLLKLEGQYTKAEEELTFSQQLGFNSLTVLVERASLEEYKGDVSAARRDIAQLEQASQTTEIDGVLLAGDYAGLHDNNAAFKTLENAFLRKDNTLLSLATSPVLEPLHQDPRYIALLRRLHFTDQIMQQIGFN